MRVPYPLALSIPITVVRVYDGSEAGSELTAKVFLYWSLILALGITAAAVEGLRGYLVFTLILALGIMALVVWKRTVWLKNAAARRDEGD